MRDEVTKEEWALIVKLKTVCPRFLLLLLTFRSLVYRLHSKLTLLLACYISTAVSMFLAILSLFYSSLKEIQIITHKRKSKTGGLHLHVHALMWFFYYVQIAIDALGLLMKTLYKPRFPAS